MKKKTKNRSGRSNGRTEHGYLDYLRNAKNRREGSIRKAEDALAYWHKHTKNREHQKLLQPAEIVAFKEKLRRPGPDGKILSPGSVNDVLVQLKQFFFWLSDQPGFKSKLNKRDLEYFSPNPEERYYQNYRTKKAYPSFEQAKLLCSSIMIDTIIDQRDRAMIAFMYLTGMRITALASMKMICFDPDTGFIDQNPGFGTVTKYSKRIESPLLDIDSDLTDIIYEWHRVLAAKGYGNNDPLFPAAEKEKDGLAFTQSTSLTREHISASRMREIIKERCSEAGLPKFNPHSFRHAIAAMALKGAKNAEEIKALSQYFGHEGIRLLLETYGPLPRSTYEGCIKNISIEIKSKKMNKTNIKTT